VVGCRPFDTCRIFDARQFYDINEQVEIIQARQDFSRKLKWPILAAILTWRLMPSAARIRSVFFSITGARQRSRKDLMPCWMGLYYDNVSCITLM